MVSDGFGQRAAWAVGLALAQGLVFNHVCFLGYGTLAVHVFMLCLLGGATARWEWLLWGFATGMAADVCSLTPGLSAAAMTAAAAVGPRWLAWLAPAGGAEEVAASPAGLGWRGFVAYAAGLSVVEQGVACGLEFCSFASAADVGLAFVSSAALTWASLLLLGRLRWSWSRGGRAQGGAR